MFVNDEAGREVLEELAGLGVRLLALRCTGFNKVDLPAARELLTAAQRGSSFPEFQAGLCKDCTFRDFMHSACAATKPRAYCTSGRRANNVVNASPMVATASTIRLMPGSPRRPLMRTTTGSTRTE